MQVCVSLHGMLDGQVASSYWSLTSQGGGQSVAEQKMVFDHLSATLANTDVNMEMSMGGHVFMKVDEHKLTLELIDTLNGEAMNALMLLGAPIEEEE